MNRKKYAGTVPTYFDIVRPSTVSSIKLL